MGTQKYGEIYQIVKDHSCDYEGSVVWHRNSWKLKIWKSMRLTVVRMSGTRDDYPKFRDLVLQNCK